MKHATRANDTAEVFTPRSLVRDMLSRLPPDVWFDPNKTWLEPAAGDGNFLVEIKARLLQAGHNERHVLNHQLFSIELIDDNHFVLQLRLGYLMQEGDYLVPGPALQEDLDLFRVATIDPLTQDLNDLSPYANKKVLLPDGTERTLAENEVYHHVNHRCASALNGIDFPGARQAQPLPVLPTRDLGDWPLTDTPEIGEPTVVTRMITNGEISVFKRASYSAASTSTVDYKPVVAKAPKPHKAPKPKKVKAEKPRPVRPASIGKQLPITQQEVEQLFGPVTVKIAKKIATWYVAGEKNIIAFSEGGGSGKDIPEDAIYLVKTDQGFFTCTKAEWCDNGTIRSAKGYQTPGLGQIAGDRFGDRANRPYRPLET